MSAPSPLHRHQSSLEGVIDISAEAPLGINQRNDGRRRFYRIVEYFGAGDAIDSVPLQYEPLRFIRSTYEYALSDDARDNFLRAFFRAMALSIAKPGDDHDLDDIDDLRPLLFGFASYLLDSLFLPSNCRSPLFPSVSLLLIFYFS